MPEVRYSLDKHGAFAVGQLAMYDGRRVLVKELRKIPGGVAADVEEMPGHDGLMAYTLAVSNLKAYDWQDDDARGELLDRMAGATGFIFHPGDRVRTRFGGHYIVSSSVHDEAGGEWVKVRRPANERRDAHILETHAIELRHWVQRIHGDWEGE